MNAATIFRSWLALGLALNLIFAAKFDTSFFGPLWLWLIAIPLLSYGLSTFTRAFSDLKRQLQRAYWRRAGVQAVRVRR